MHIRILFLSLFLCSTYTSSAQKLWLYAKENCMPTDLSQHKLYFPITVKHEKELPYNYDKAKKIFKKYYPYRYVFITDDSLRSMSIDSLVSAYALRKEEVTRTTTTSRPQALTYPGAPSLSNHYPSGSYTSTYRTYKYKFTKSYVNYTEYKPLDIYSTARYRSLRILLKNIYYDIPSNKPTHCFKINLVAPIPNYSRIGASYECLIHRKTSLGVYVEGGSWKYPYSAISPYMSSDFVLFQPQLIRYFNLFKNNAYDGLFLGIAPFAFYNKDHLNPANPDVTELTQTTTGYGAKGMIGYQCIVGKTFIVGAWGGPQYRFNVNNDTYENTFLSSNYPSLAFTGQVFVGFVLK